MRKVIFRFLFLLAALGLSATGCIQSHQGWVREPATVAAPSGEVIVTETPPPPQREVVSTPPDQSHVWVEGYWSSTNGKWVWIPGHWEIRPRPNAVWTPGHWDKNVDGRGWTWTPGRWD